MRGNPLRECPLRQGIAIGSVLTDVVQVHYNRENARRDRVYGKVHPDALVDTSELADQVPNFRYNA